MHPAAAIAALAEAFPDDGIVVPESPATTFALRARLRLSRPGSYYFTAGGGLGFALPASIGVQMAEPDRPVVCVLGEGSAQYAIQAFWTAVAYAVPVTFLVLRNEEYAILKWFGEIEQVTGAPGLDLPALEVASVAEGYGVESVRVDDPAALTEALRDGIAAAAPRLVEARVAPGMAFWPQRREHPAAVARSPRSPRTPPPLLPRRLRPARRLLEALGLVLGDQRLLALLERVGLLVELLEAVLALGLLARLLLLRRDLAARLLALALGLLRLALLGLALLLGLLLALLGGAARRLLALLGRRLALGQLLVGRARLRLGRLAQPLRALALPSPRCGGGPRRPAAPRRRAPARRRRAARPPRGRRWSCGRPRGRRASAAP